MNWLRTIAREVFGLFVDDGSFALLILAWIGVTAYVLPRLGWLPRGRGVLLFAGLAIILVESAIRYTRRKQG